MDISKLKHLVDQGFSTYKIADELNTSQTNIRYWLKKEQLKTKVVKTSDYKTRTEHTCSLCNQTKPISEFYSVTKRSKSVPFSYCRSCASSKASADAKARRLEHKNFAIQYKGGKCEVCGYDKCPNAMDFHHIDPSEKDVGIAEIFTAKNIDIDRLKAELDKCLLLCVRCHRELHAGYISYP